MLIFRTIVMWLLMCGVVGPGASVQARAASAQPAVLKRSAPEEEQALPQKAVEVARPSGFSVTNSMIVTWVVAVGLIFFAQAATRDMKRIPTGAQNFWEWLVE